MARDNFPACLKETLKWEVGSGDGFVNHPADPGGATQDGITLATYRRFKPDATVADLRAMPKSVRDRIYKGGYWDTIKGDELPQGLDMAGFDLSVNSGPARAKQYLFDANGRAGGVGDQIKYVCGRRLAWYQTLRTWSAFGKGWARRIASIEAVALRMWLGNTTVGRETMTREAQAAEAKKQKNGKVATGAGAGGTATTTSGPSITDDQGAMVAIVVFGVIILAIAAVAFINWRNQRERAQALSDQAEDMRRERSKA